MIYRTFSKIPLVAILSSLLILACAEKKDSGVTVKEAGKQNGDTTVQNKATDEKLNKILDNIKTPVNPLEVVDGIETALIEDMNETQKRQTRELADSIKDIERIRFNNGQIFLDISSSTKDTNGVWLKISGKVTQTMSELKVVEASERVQSNVGAGKKKKTQPKLIKARAQCTDDLCENILLVLHDKSKGANLPIFYRKVVLEEISEPVSLQITSSVENKLMEKINGLDVEKEEFLKNVTSGELEYLIVSFTDNDRLGVANIKLIAEFEGKANSNEKIKASDIKFDWTSEKAKVLSLP